MHFSVPVFLLFLSSMSHAANIAMFVSIGSHSHVNIYTAVAKVLIEDGHNITFFNALVETKFKNFTSVRPKAFADVFKNSFTKNSLFHERTTGVFMTEMNYHIFDSSVDMCRTFLESEELKSIIKSDISFDLVMVNPLFGECGLILGYYYNAPVVHLGTSGIYAWGTHGFAIPGLTLFKADTFIWTSQNVLKFSQRFTTATLHFLVRFLQVWYSFPRTEELFREHFGPHVPSVVEMERNSSLLFLNSNIGLEPPIPYMPNVVEIGGIHCTPAKPIPQELSEFVESSSGLILFSMGSLVKAADMPHSYRNALLDAFSRLPYKVIWKWDDEQMDGVTIPKNVMITKWMPQNDLLGHNKTKLFITHGGKQSTIESLYHGVPLIVVPIFSDQDLNAFLAQERGYGIFLEAIQLQSTKTVLDAITTILNDDKYKNNARKFSAIMQDQPLSPKESVSYWTNYVLRHKGVPLMKHPARSMHWIHYYQVDVLVTISLIVTFFIVIAVKIICALLRKCTGH